MSMQICRFYVAINHLTYAATELLLSVLKSHQDLIKERKRSHTTLSFDTFLACYIVQTLSI